MNNPLKTVLFKRGQPKTVSGYFLEKVKSHENKFDWICKFPKSKYRSRAVTSIVNGQHYLSKLN